MSGKSLFGVLSFCRAVLDGETVCFVTGDPARDVEQLKPRLPSGTWLLITHKLDNPFFSITAHAHRSAP